MTRTDYLELVAGAAALSIAWAAIFNAPEIIRNLANVFGG